jgi:hypothetical protein
MKNLIFKLAAGVVSGAVVAIIVTPAQAASVYTFRQVFDGGEVLSGEFSGADTDNNGQIDFSEFTSFTSTFVSAEPGFENLSWGLGNLANFSYFASADDYNFWVTDPAPYPPGGKGWNSNGQEGSTFVGFSFVEDGPIAAVFSASEPLNITPVPESSSPIGLLLATAGIVLLGRKKF